MSYEDPFSFVITALWDSLERNNEFRGLVRETNRIKLDAGFRPFKATLMESSVPEVQILPNGLEFFAENTCNGKSMVLSVQIIATSGVQNTSVVFPLLWRIAQGIGNALYGDSNTLYDLKWKDESIIKLIEILPVEIGLTYDDLSRELKGWAAIVPVRLKVWLSNTLLTIS